MDYGVLIFTIIMIFLDISYCKPYKARLSCDKRRAGKLYPVVLSDCKYYYSCQKSINRGLVPIPYQCPRGLLFDFKMQTCVVPNGRSQCQDEPDETRCQPKCDCKLCYCHNAFCESDCDDYKKRWCRGRSSRSPEISSPLQHPPEKGIPIFINATFDCSDKYAGVYYSDPQFDCRVFHSCVQKRFGGPIFRKSKLCPGETAFDQIKLSCRPMGSFDCVSVTKWYFLRTSWHEKPSVPAKIASIHRLSIKDVLPLTEVVVHSVTDSPTSTHPPPESVVPVISVINPSNQHQYETELSGQLPTCPYHQCCPGVCPPCHEICPRGPCSDNWCENYYDLSAEDLSSYLSPEINDFQDHILYFGESESVTDNFTVRSQSVSHRDTCEGKIHGGIYANMTSDCKSFYACINDATRENLIEHINECPRGTYFNQKTRICDWTLTISCSESHLYF